ncbi:MAG TPA: hypothetical protein VG815_13820 [Chloroflexota bacterium]|jgi:hypothetical protein|nr:hypothetical protein [Chloroflexota bacterium]
MWVALSQTVAPGLEEPFRRLIKSRGEELGELGRRYGLLQLRVFQQANLGLMFLEVEDATRFGEIAHDPDFQVLGQDMASVMNLGPLEAGQFWPEIFAWESAGSMVEEGV